jgi:DNA-binding NarL/FixJ family response regulator
VGEIDREEDEMKLDDNIRVTLDDRDLTLRDALSAVEGIVLAEDRPDVVLLDLSKHATIGEILRARPNAAVLVFAGPDDDRSLLAALRAGARGYLPRSSGADDVVRAIRELAGGGAFFGAPIADRLAELLAGIRDQFPYLEFTKRERDVLDLVADGLTNSAIASRLALAPKTIRNLMSTIFAKLHVSSRAEAIERSRDFGFGRQVAAAICSA